MAALPKTVEEYLAFERSSDEKHEFVDGEVYAMSGAKLSHVRIVRNTMSTLANQLADERCEPLSNDMRLKVSPRDYTYPDIIVVCGEPQLVEDAYLDTLLNPTLIVEVLSPSTEKFDRTRKFELYRQIESLREYVLIAQDRPRIERYLRHEAGEWLYKDAAGLELQSIGCTLHLGEVYRQVTFEDDAENTVKCRDAI